MKLWRKLRRRFNNSSANTAKPSKRTTVSQKAHAVVAQPSNQINHIIAIASGKGGVGKSTVTHNLAYALQAQGHKVGILDADIYGPSQAQMMQSTQQAEVDKGLMLPLVKNGVKFISMSAVNPKGGAVIVRSAIAIRAINQFLNGVKWGALDYLLIDLPPGTGDIQLSLAQKTQLSGVVIVTTPQQLAVDIAKKSLQMFQKVNVPILGVIENMSGYICQHCHQENHIFSEGGGKQLAQREQLPLLGQIPLAPDILMASQPGMHNAFITAAQSLQAALTQQSENIALEPKEVSMLEQQSKLLLVWPDEARLEIKAHQLRALCSCAACRDEITGEVLIKEDNISKSLTIQQVKPVGRYGLGIRFSDGHATGIYRFELLRAQLPTA